jgi:hypothetical protein
MNSAQFGHPNQGLHIVRYWIPHLRILSPREHQDEVEAGVEAYLGRCAPAYGHEKEHVRRI